MVRNRLYRALVVATAMAAAAVGIWYFFYVRVAAIPQVSAASVDPAKTIERASVAPPVPAPWTQIITSGEPVKRSVDDLIASRQREKLWQAQSIVVLCALTLQIPSTQEQARTGKQAAVMIRGRQHCAGINDDAETYSKYLNILREYLGEFPDARLTRVRATSMKSGLDQRELEAIRSFITGPDMADVWLMANAEALKSALLRTQRFGRFSPEELSAAIHLSICASNGCTVSSVLDASLCMQTGWRVCGSDGIKSSVEERFSASKRQQLADLGVQITQLLYATDLEALGIRKKQ